jgi:hypothetical protein
MQQENVWLVCCFFVLQKAGHVSIQSITSWKVLRKFYFKRLYLCIFPSLQCGDRAQGLTHTMTTLPLSHNPNPTYGIFYNQDLIVLTLNEKGWESQREKREQLNSKNKIFSP